MTRSYGDVHGTNAAAQPDPIVGQRGMATGRSTSGARGTAASRGIAADRGVYVD